jgi:SPP1 family phage portal protein
MFTPFFDRRPTIKQVREAYRALIDGQARLDRLHCYYLGQNDVRYRQKREGQPNFTLSHPFARYIATLASGYMLGEGLCYTARDETRQKELCRLVSAAVSADLDSDLALSQSIFGRAISVAWKKNGMHLAALDPRQAAVFYSPTADAAPLMGLLLSGNKLSVYTREEIISYQVKNQDRLELLGASRHGFSDLPMVEYKNNPFRQGDFEHVLPLIDAYDLLQSDRMNDRQQFADALLVLTGVMGVEGADKESLSTILKRERTLSLPDSDAKAQWLVKTPNESDVDILRSALSEDIHKFAMVPDFTRQWNANSEAAEKYKRYCLKLLAKQKERFFLQGAYRRTQLIVSGNPDFSGGFEVGIRRNEEGQVQ